MDFRALLAAPLAAVVVTSSATELRMPNGWMFIAPPNEYAAGVDPQLDEGGRHTLTVRSVSPRGASNFGAVEQAVLGYGGRRVRFSGQVRASGVDVWAGLMVGHGFFPLGHMLQSGPDAPGYRPFGAPACAQWCAVSVVADVPEGEPWVDVGVALIGNGQVWARDLRLEVVGNDVPLSTGYVGLDPAVERASRRRQDEARAAHMTPPRNLALE